METIVLNKNYASSHGNVVKSHLSTSQVLFQQHYYGNYVIGM